ncbi:MAG: class I SAM-dependent methyltransferase [Pseudomonadota bacterium]
MRSDKLNFDEGLGTVYERFILNDFFDALVKKHHIISALETPLYGMTGVTGINSVHLIEKGCKVTLLDSCQNNIKEAANVWQLLPHSDSKYEILHHTNLSALPFQNNAFDLVWNFAALWHVRDVAGLIREMVRVSSNLIVIMMPNKIQIGYFLRKYFLDKNFFDSVEETWADINKISYELNKSGANMVSQGVLDVPPWPDTCMPIGDILKKLKIKRSEKVNNNWKWDIVSYYRGKNQTLKQKIEKFSFIERLNIPWQLKALWAHHRYVIFSKN